MLAQNKFSNKTKKYLAPKYKWRYCIRVMKTNPTQIASQIAEIVLSKGVAFAGFDYNGKRRNVTVGAHLDRFVSGGKNNKSNWGSSFTNGSLVAYKGKMFLQAVENAKGGTDHQIKRFDLAKATNFVIG